MPTYNYLCNECGKEQEAFHGINDNIKTCYHCGSDNIKKIFKTPPSVKYNCSGFYKTDN